MSNYRIGHAHLKVRNLEKSEAFYRDLLGFTVTERAGRHFVFLSGGPMHHELALQEVGSQAPIPTTDSVGLYHIAFEASSKSDLTDAIEKLERLGIRNSVVDHGISQAVYFSDPDGNGLEIYLDTRSLEGGRESWQGFTERIS